MSTDDLPQLLSVTRAAEILDCSRGHVYNLIASGALEAVDIRALGTRPKARIRESELARFIEERTA